MDKKLTLHKNTGYDNSSIPKLQMLFSGRLAKTWLTGWNGWAVTSNIVMDVITQTPDKFSLADAAWKHPKYPCFSLLPLEFGVNNDIHKY